MNSKSTTTKATPRRKMAREPGLQTPPSAKPSKLDLVETMLCANGGASIAELMAATGWQQHSVRGVMAGAMKKRCLAIFSEKVDGVRRYRAARQ